MQLHKIFSFILKRKKGIGLFFLFFVLFILDTRWHFLTKILMEISAPFSKGITYAWHSLEEIKQTYLNIKKIKEENQLLKKKLQTLEAKQIWCEELLHKNQRLEKLLGLKKELPYPSIGARVIAYSPQFNPKIIFLDKGKKDGVKLHSPVISIKGIVGQVVALSPHYAKVLTIIDSNSKVEVMSQRTRIHGIFLGTGMNRGKIKYIPKEEDVKIGDLFITSGLDGIFPKGIPVGQVIHISEPIPSLFKEIELKTSVDFQRLEELIVLLKKPQKLNHE